MVSEENTTNGVAKSAEWLDAEVFDENPSRLSGVIFTLLCFVPMIFTVAYGAVDVWTLGFQAIFIGLIASLWCLESFFTKEFRFSPSVLQIPLAALILIGLIQLLPFRGGGNSLSLDGYSTRFAVIQLIIYLIFFSAALVFINSRKRLQRLVASIIIFASIMAFFGILQRLANLEAIYGLRPSTQAISFGSFVNQHHFAAFMEMSIGLTIALLFGKAVKKDKNLLLIISAVIMGIAVILTGSRGGLLSLLGVLAFIIAANLLGKKEGGRSSGFRRNFALIGGGVALVLVIFGAVFLLGGDQSLLRGTGLQNASADLSSGRTHFWRTALKIFFDYPILGVGFNAFGAVFPQYDTWNGTLRVEQAHNDYLQMLTEAGVLGLACVVGFIFLLFKKTLRTLSKTTDLFRRHTAIGALAGCFGVLLHSFFDFPLRTPSNGFFFLLLTVIATISIGFPKSHHKR